MSADNEYQVIGGLLKHPDMIARVDISADDFTVPLCAMAFAAMRAIVAEGKAVDVFGVSERCGGDAELGNLAALWKDCLIRPENLQDRCEKLKALSRGRQMVDLLKLATQTLEEGKSPDAVRSRLITKLASLESSGKTFVHTAKQTMAEVVDYLQAAFDARETGGLVGVTSGLSGLDRLLGGFHKSDLIVVGARPAMGKAQPLDANVLLENGRWKRMGDIRVGDKVASIDGAESFVSGVFPQGKKQIYGVEFNDGRVAECCDEHLWKVTYRDWGSSRVLTTARLREMLRCKRYQNRLYVDMVDGIFGDSSLELPIHPYVLGVLIGDGQLSGTLRVSSDDQQIIERFSNLLGDGVALGYHDGKYTHNVVDLNKNGKFSSIRDALRGLGLWGTDSYTKFIPEIYFSADRESRLELMRGLMDTDGWAEKHASCAFSTSSQALARDFVRLARSLGCRSQIKQKSPIYTNGAGNKVRGAPSYVCRVGHPIMEDFFSLDRKKERAKRGRNSTVRLNIASITPTRVSEAQCISVTHETHLYITDEYIVTHNTAFMASLAKAAALNGRRVGIASAEMPAVQIGLRMVSMFGGIASTKLRSCDLDEQEFTRLNETAQRYSELPIEIFDKPSCSPGDIAIQARAWQLSGGLDLLMVDYLTRLNPDESQDSRVREVGQMVQSLKTLAKSLNIPVICLAQLSRQCEQRADKRPVMADLRDSGEIEQEADSVMFLYRDVVYNDQANPEEAEILVEKNRHGPCGKVIARFVQEQMLWTNAGGEAWTN